VGCLTRGYQPAGNWLDRPSLFALPEIVGDERQWMLDELRRWALRNGGLAPRKKDWSKEHHPDRLWPRSDRVTELFEGEALAAGVRRWVDRRCASDCPCSSNRHYTNDAGEALCDGCFDCLGHCPHGSVGHWVGHPAGGMRSISPDWTCKPAPIGAAAMRDRGGDGSSRVM
jgi:hypothetical protein